MLGQKMIVSSDDAREALASVEAIEQRVMDYAEREHIWSGFVASGWAGLIGFASQSRFAELWFGSKILSGWWGAIAILLLGSALPVLALSPFWRPIIVKPRVRMKTIAVGGAIALWLLLPFLPKDSNNVLPELTTLHVFFLGFGWAVASMLWLGRWYAFAALALILSIGAIQTYEPLLEIRFSYLALLSGFVLLPAGIWMMRKDRQHGA